MIKQLRTLFFFRLLAGGAALWCGWAAPALFATDAEAEADYMKGLAAYKDGDFRTASDEFEKAYLDADTPAIRANSLLAQIGAWRMCGMLFKEYTAIELLINSYPEYAADFAGLVNREFEIGREFCRGHRDPMYAALSWIPWLTGPDKSIEIFEQALRRAPFAEAAPEARLHLAYLYQEEGKIPKAMEQLRMIIKEHPGSSACRYAYLALADVLFELASRGDGDGRYVREAVEVLNDFEKRYPDAAEQAWAKRKFLAAKDIQAQKLYEMAEFYRKAGKGDAASRYLARVVRDYPESTSAVKSESALAKADETFVPGDFPKNGGSRLPDFRAYEIPEEAGEVLILPGAGGNHYLLPVPELKPRQEGSN